jgi:cation-transporting ATPase 13A2
VSSSIAQTNLRFVSDAYIGESVPVSKTPVTDESVKLLDLAASSIHPNLAKHFLFCGTKIVRARRPQDDSDDEAVALAVVVRTGFNTTKGALVRSMLFPKPSGFKFYRDSFRYISVMAVIALCGFVASFVNFIRLKVGNPDPFCIYFRLHVTSS